MKVLDLSLKYRWFDMIAAGEKKEEYRDITQYWCNRLLNPIPSSLFSPQRAFKDFDFVRFHRGQGSKVTMLVKILSMHRGYGRWEWGAKRGKEYFVIRLGEIVK